MFVLSVHPEATSTTDTHTAHEDSQHSHATTVCSWILPQAELITGKTVFSWTLDIYIDRKYVKRRRLTLHFCNA